MSLFTSVQLKMYLKSNFKVCNPVYPGVKQRYIPLHGFFVRKLDDRHPVSNVF